MIPSQHKITLFPYTTLFRSVYVSTQCPPYPPQFDTSGVLPGCAEALAAGSRGDVCFADGGSSNRSEEHTSELQSRRELVCRLLLEKKKIKNNMIPVDLTYRI